MGKPKLEIDLQGSDGNIYMVIAKARQIVPSKQLNDFINVYLDAQKPGANKTYEDMLVLVNQYVELIDTSGLYPAYSPKKAELPPLVVNLIGSFSDIHIVIDLARNLLSQEKQSQFERELQPLMRHFAWKKQKEILAIIAKYVHLQDASGTFPEYPVVKEEGGE